MKVWITTVFALLAVPAVALGASAKPTVRTGGVAKLAPSTASLLGRVDPNGAVTSYLFQYGPTSLYGSLTAAVPVGGGAKAIDVVADVAGLTPATVYHYRIVAKNRNGMTRGEDRTFKTRPQPLALTLTATPNPVPFGQPTVLNGTVTGTGSAGSQVVLQSNPFPYTQGFVTTTNIQLANAQGAFAFPLLSVPLNTQYRVLIATRPAVVGPVLSVGVAVHVGTAVSATRVHRGRRVRFSGTIRPARDGAQVAIQKLRGTNWITVAGTITHHAGASYSSYSKRVRIAHGGSYRVFVGIVDGNFVSNAGGTMRIHTR
jgi:hypothetical protein